MTGKQVRKKIKAKGYTFRAVAQAIGESDANLQHMLNAADVKSGTLERIAAAMNVNVAYFYNEQPIFSIADYVEYSTVRRENELLRELVAEKDRRIELLTNRQQAADAAPDDSSRRSRARRPTTPHSDTP